MGKIIVTGANGFIGSHLVKALREERHEVRTLTNYMVKEYPTGLDCDRIYHLAAPSTTEFISKNPLRIMQLIIENTISALKINRNALFINASSMGATDIETKISSPQGGYNIAKLCMEEYVLKSPNPSKSYRIPSTYGEGMHNDAFIKRCVEGRAYKPNNPNKTHYIAHIDEVIRALVAVDDIQMEEITLGEIYESFNSGRRGIHWNPLNEETTGGRS